MKFLVKLLDFRVVHGPANVRADQGQVFQAVVDLANYREFRLGVAEHVSVRIGGQQLLAVSPQRQRGDMMLVPEEVLNLLLLLWICDRQRAGFHVCSDNCFKLVDALGQIR